jgi:hypothetical protein
MRLRPRWVAFSVTAVLLLALATTRPLAPHDAAVHGNPVLSWPPRPCGDASHSCRDLYLRDNGVNKWPGLDRSVDYRIHLPTNSPLTGGLQIRGGRNVQLIGGQIDLTTPCRDSRYCHGLYIVKTTPGQVFIEGLYIRNPDPTHSHLTGDGIDVDLRPGHAANDIVLQNVRIEGMDGCEKSRATHADVLQTYRAPDANLRIDHLTGTTDCQGMQLDPDLAWSVDGTTARSQTLRNVNIRVDANPHSGEANRYAAWFTYGDRSCVTAPTLLENVYVSEPDGALKGNSIWPDTDRPARCESAWSAGDRQISFPRSPRIKGVITAGLPPGGDYVPPNGNVGLGYKSPGYRR